MNKYTIRCTSEQTKKALNLGAPIKHSNLYFEGSNLLEPGRILYAVIPTSEQMIGWLEEQINVREICILRYGNWGYEIFIDPYSHLEDNGFASRKKATLAAMDAALEYLTKNKK